MKRIGDTIMDWLRRNRDPQHMTDLLEKVDNSLVREKARVELYRRQLEVLTGQSLTWPFVERRKKPRN